MNRDPPPQGGIPRFLQQWKVPGGSHEVVEMWKYMPLVFLFFVSCACEKPGDVGNRPLVDLGSDALQNRTPYVPPQCYTKTRSDDGRVHNPCFVCHQDSIAPNTIDDADLQLAYDFAPAALENPWTNLFADRSEAVAAISDKEILAWVRYSNYLAEDGSPILAKKLASVPEAWDVDGNGRWDGWIPDIAFRFDEEGFDHGRAGPTGWRAFTYHPFPGTFWPTNGSFGDALIRLPEVFRLDGEGHFDRSVYRVNLAVVEAAITRRDVEIPPVDEEALGVDLDGDGVLSVATSVHFAWAPRDNRLRLVGKAEELRREGRIQLEPGLFPAGTELAHSVRYLDLDQTGKAVMAPRMKELRYMVKQGWLSPGTLQTNVFKEARQKEWSPDKLRTFGGSAERGIGNRSGWRLQAFIEDAVGELRPQSREEHAFCIGCHSGIGATTDSVFSFARKLPGSIGWSKRDLGGVGERIRADGRGEYTAYLEENGAGDEYRSNRELLERFFLGDGTLKPGVQGSLAQDIESLLLPSRERALALNKAYRVLVGEQSFVRGRDATVTPLEEVHRRLPRGEEPEPTGVEIPVRGPWR